MVKKAGGKGSVHPEKFTSEEALLEHYTDIITQLSESPYRLDLHEEHVALTRQLNMTDELESARQLMSEYFPLSEGSLVPPVLLNCKFASSDFMQPPPQRPGWNGSRTRKQR